MHVNRFSLFFIFNHYNLQLILVFYTKAVPQTKPVLPLLLKKWTLLIYRKYQNDISGIIKNSPNTVYTLVSGEPADSLFFDDCNFLHHLWFIRLVHHVSWLLNYVICCLHTFNNLAEGCVLSIKMRCRCNHDEEL